MGVKRHQSGHAATLSDPATKIGAVAGVRQLEISPVLRRVKQAGTLMDGLRLASLPPPA
jgi:hypothetical protein